ncbi:MAG: CHAT domain-containing protein [Candidatus Freyarchaeota archaeon]|nr:CHAT domain-containing protein [Candidatus Jordarchaeia archaeon]
MSSSELDLEKALFLYERGLDLVEREDWDGALLRFEKALDVFGRAGSEVEVSLCLKALGKIYGFLGRWDKAAEYVERDLEIQIWRKNGEEILSDINLLVTYLTRSHNYERVISHLEKVHSLFEKLGDKKSLTSIQMHLGQVYEKGGDQKKALKYYEGAFELGKNLDLPHILKLESKIRELASQKFEVQIVGGVEVKSQAERYQKEVGKWEEESGEELLAGEPKLAREKVWIPQKVLGEGLRSSVIIKYREFMEMGKEQTLNLVLEGEITFFGRPEAFKSVVEKISGTDIEVLILAPHFDVGEPRRKIAVPIDGETRTLQVKLTPRKLGRHKIFVEFYFQGMLLRRVVADVFVKEAPEEALETRRKIEFSLYPDVDLDATLRIHRFQNRLYFHLFTRHAEELVQRGEFFGSSEIDSTITERLLLHMKNIAFDGEQPQRVMTILTEIGRKAYSLIPKGIRDSIKYLNPRHLILETEDLFVPFELAYDEEDFLCLKYCLGKIILSENSEYSTPPPRIEAEKLRIKLVATETKKETATREKEFLKRAQASELILAGTEKGDRNGFKKVLSEGVDVIHIRCPVIFDEQQPTRPKLVLSDATIEMEEIEKLNIEGNPIIFADLHEETKERKGTGAKRFVGTATIAKTFLSRGAAAVIAPLWEIPENLASEVAMKFYEKIIPGRETLGIMMRETKKELKQKYSGTLWATFNLYGPPTLKIAK